MRKSSPFPRAVFLGSILALALALCAAAGLAAGQTSGMTSDSAGSLASAPAAGSVEDAGLVELRRLGEYLAKAAEASPELAAAWSEWKAATEKAPQAAALPDPRASLGYFIRSVETRVGPQRARIGLTQAIPFPGKLSLKEKAAIKEAEARRARFEALRLAVLSKVKDAWYEHAYLSRAASITADAAELARYLEGVATARYTAAASPYSDVLAVQVEIDRIEDRLAGIRDMQRPVSARLMAAMDMEPSAAPGTDLPAPRTVPILRIVPSDAELFTMLEAANPQLEVWEALAEKELAGRDLAKKDYFPDVTFGLETVLTDPALSSMQPDSGKDPWVASVSMNLPIWQENRAAAVREAEFRRTAALKGREALCRKLEIDMQLALYKYRDAERRIALYGEALIPRADEALQVALEAYQAGSRGSVDMIGAQKALLELELAYARAVADQAQRVAEMEAILGREIPCEVGGLLLPDKAAVWERLSDSQKELVIDLTSRHPPGHPSRLSREEP